MDNLDFNVAQRNLSALVDFGKLVNSSLDLRSILNNLLLTCMGKFHTTRGIVALFDENNELSVKASKGFTEDSLHDFPPVKLIKQKYDTQKLIDFREKHKLEFGLELNISQGLAGIVFLGERISKREYSQDDRDFITTIINVAATAIENSLMFNRLKAANRNLDSKVSMLSSLFELSKEFGGILETQRVMKLLMYSVIGQLLVSKYAIAMCEKNGLNIIESKFPKALINEAVTTLGISSISSPLRKDEILTEYKELFSIGIELIIPMQMHGETKGIIFLGSRSNKEDYSDIDIEFIYSIGSLAIISIENAKLFKETLEKQRMEEDLEIARTIQKNLLPKIFPKLKSFELSALNISSKQVGGDYYDIIKLDSNHCLFAVGDVSGKGVPASLLMANLQAILKTISKSGMELNEATGIINDLVTENTMGENFITFFWGILNDLKKTLLYVNAGHNPPLLIRDGQIRKLTKGGMILGVLKTLEPYKYEEIQLQENDVLILFTDGVTEALNKKMEEFTDERLENTVLSLCTRSPKEIINDIIASVKTFVEGATQSDDITLMVVKVK